MRLNLIKIVSIMFFSLMQTNVYSYDFSGINGIYDFGVVIPSFPDLTVTDNNICVGYILLVDPSNYRVRATSSSNPSGNFQLTNSTNNSYKINYTVRWAGSSGGSPTYTSLVSGQNSSSTFPAQLLGGLTCLLLSPNATLQLNLPGASQVLAKQGSYTDTLTILIIAA